MIFSATEGSASSSIDCSDVTIVFFDGFLPSIPDLVWGAMGAATIVHLT